MIIIMKGEKFLLGKRSDWKAKAPGFWCPISGHVEAGETEEQAVIREAQEELGVEVKPLYKIISSPTNDNTVLLHWWMTSLISGEVRLNNNENSELGWFSKGELVKLKPVFKEDIEILLSCRP